MVKSILLVFAFIFISSEPFAQAARSTTLNSYSTNKIIKLDTPVVGQKCPDFFLDNILYYKTKKANLNNFKGKWLILDFWTKYCAACLASFPHTDDLQKKFADRVQFLLIGVGSEEDIKPIAEKARKRLKLNLPVAVDTLIMKRFGIYGVPSLVWIDENGIVRAVTQAEFMTEKNLSAFLSGENIVLPVKQSSWVYKYANDTTTLNKMEKPAINDVNIIRTVI